MLLIVVGNTPVALANRMERPYRSVKSAGSDFPWCGFRRNIRPVLGKVRPTTHRGNGSASQPEAGLPEGRLALVHRYMIDAEEAETLAQSAAEKGDARAREEALVAAGAPEEASPTAAEETLRSVPATMPNVAPHALEEGGEGNGRPDPREESRARKALAKADKQAARQAARRIAALEKKEARERRALAKAASRRRTA